MYVRTFFQIRFTVGVALLFRDVGGYPPHGTDLGGYPGPGSSENNRAASTSELGREMGVHLDKGGMRGGGVQAGR